MASPICSPSTPVKYVYYITGHGFGHATRSKAIISELLATRDCQMHVVSSCTPSFFQDLLTTYPSSFHLHTRKLDTGAIQLNALSVDPSVTLDTYYNEIHTKRSDLIETELQWIRGVSPNVCIVDATPLGCVVGKLAGARVVLLTNFEWAYILKHNLDNVKELSSTEPSRQPTSLNPQSPYASSVKPTQTPIHKLEEMVDQVTRDYAEHVDLYLQLPARATPPTGFPLSRLVYAPLICRKHMKSRDEILQKYGIDATTKKVLLLGFGGHDVSMWSLQDSYLPPDWICLVLGGCPVPETSKFFISLPFDTYVPDLVNASDVVLGKVGYGFVSECLSHLTPLVYISRSYWAEEECLTKLLSDYNAGVEMKFDDFISGQWESSLNKALDMKEMKWTLNDTDQHIDATARTIKMIDDFFKE